MVTRRPRALSRLPEAAGGQALAQRGGDAAGDEHVPGLADDCAKGLSRGVHAGRPAASARDPREFTVTRRGVPLSAAPCVGLGRPARATRRRDRRLGPRLSRTARVRPARLLGQREDRPRPARPAGPRRPPWTRPRPARGPPAPRPTSPSGPAAAAAVPATTAPRPGAVQRRHQGGERRAAAPAGSSPRDRDRRSPPRRGRPRSPGRCPPAASAGWRSRPAPRWSPPRPGRRSSPPSSAYDSRAPDSTPASSLSGSWKPAGCRPPVTNAFSVRRPARVGVVVGELHPAGHRRAGLLQHLLDARRRCASAACAVATRTTFASAQRAGDHLGRQGRGDRRRRPCGSALQRPQVRLQVALVRGQLAHLAAQVVQDGAAELGGAEQDTERRARGRRRPGRRCGSGSRSREQAPHPGVRVVPPAGDHRHPGPAVGGQRQHGADRGQRGEHQQQQRRTRRCGCGRAGWRAFASTSLPPSRSRVRKVEAMPARPRSRNSSSVAWRADGDDQRRRRACRRAAARCPRWCRRPGR